MPQDEFERRLRASEERFRLAAEAVQGMIYDWDVASDHVYRSEGLLALTGHRPEDVPPTASWWLEVMHPDDAARLAPEIADPTRTRSQNEYRVRHADGRWVHVRDHAIFLRDAAGTLVRAVGNTVSIDDRWRAEQRLEAVLASIDDHLVSYDGDWRYTFVNDAAARVLGKRPEALLGQSIWDLFPEARGNEYDLRLREAVRERRVVRFEHYYPSWDRWFDNHVYPSADGVTVFGADVTARKRAEQALQESESRFRTMADHISQLAWMADAEGAVFWFNARWYAYTGTAPDAVLGWGWQSVHDPEHVEGVVARLRQAFARGEVWEDTFPLRRHDGVYRWFLSRAVPLRDASGRVDRWFGTHTDVTEQRAVQEALREAHRRKDDFLAMLGHELRNPLGPIRNAVLVIRQTEGDDARARRAQDIIERQVAHMARMVDDLLDVSRITRGQVPLRSGPCDLAALVRDAVEDYRDAFDARGVALAVHGLAQPLPVLGDPTRLAQVVGNLLHNALKFTDAGGSVEVRARAEADDAVLSVVDDGVGMPPALLADVFEPFTQAERSLDRSHGGLGLGLALVKGIVALHGGTVEATSEGVGRGATFTVRLPKTAQAAPAEAAPPEASSRRLRVLVVEDNLDAAESLQMLLELIGHDADVAHDGPTALERATAALPDVVLCDIGLPRGMNGYDVARAVRGRLGAQAPRLVALTGYGQDEDVRLARESGFDEHLVKPADFTALVGALARVPTRGARPS